MGLFDADARSHHTSPTRARSTGHGTGYTTRPTAAARSTPGSYFGGGASSSRGIFGSSSGGGGSSYYKRRPRDGYIASLLHKLQRMIKELWVYARRHPVKTFFAVVVPLLSAGGAIGGLMTQFGVKLPMGLGGMGGSGKRQGGGGYYGSRGYDGGFGGGGSGGAGWMDNAGSLFTVAKMFM